MNVKTTSSGSTEYYDPKEMEKEIDRMVEIAVNAAAKGENIEQLQEIMLVALPAKMRESMKKKFAAALAKRKMHAPTGEADIPSRTTLSRIRKLFTESARAAMQKVVNLLRSRPDIAEQVKQVGQALAKSGVVFDKTSQVTEADLGQISPTAGVGTRGNQTGKGV